MMLTLGIDIGSTAIKCVILEGGSRIAGHSLLSLGAGAGDAAEAAAAALREAGAKRETLDAVVATGYGRALVPFAAASRSLLRASAAATFSTTSRDITSPSFYKQNADARSARPDAHHCRPVTDLN